MVQEYLIQNNIKFHFISRLIVHHTEEGERDSYLYTNHGYIPNSISKLNEYRKGSLKIRPIL